MMIHQCSNIVVSLLSAIYIHSYVIAVVPIAVTQINKINMQIM